MASRSRSTTKSALPNGPAAAALLAGGIGSAVLGIVTTLNETSDGIANALRWSTAVGPLSGKVGVTIIIYLIAWAILHFAWKDKDVNFRQITTIAFILLAIGLLGTFPPFFEIFASE